jgi:translation initiation factor 1A
MPLGHTAQPVPDDTDPRELRLPTGTQLFAVVTDIRSDGHATLRCADRKERLGKVPGRLRSRVWIHEGDVVLAEPWGWEDERAEIVWRYTHREVKRLRSDGRLTF